MEFGKLKEGSKFKLFKDSKLTYIKTSSTEAVTTAKDYTFGVILSSEFRVIKTK